MDEQVGEQHDRKFANIARNIRTGSPTPNSRGKNDDLESRNFTLQEEVKDLRIQLGGKQNDINKIQELLNKRTGIFNGANKTLMELRQTVASKDSEIEELKATIESMKEKYEEAKNIVDESKKSTEKLTTEMHSQSATYNAQIEQLESKLRQSNQQIVQVKEEFQQYKTRAHALLEQKNSRGENDTEILELVAANKKLESELIFKSSELKYAQDKLKVAERDLKPLKETEARYLANVEDFEDRLKNAIEAKEKNLKQKQEENEALQKISEQLGEELSQVRLELSQRNEQIEELKKQISGKTQVASISAVKNVIKNDSSRSSSPLSFTSRNSNTLSDLLADMEERTSNVSDKDKDNTFKLQHMAEMLNESEAQVQKLLDQEKILKEEIRKLDRLEKRQNLSVEYLKNVVLKFFETEPSGREPLVPVISTILQLSPEETKSLKENAIDATNSNQVVIGFGVL
ncbi:16599_t:CDS:10 [Rhizophagus irregularis]|nr:16599_t:CDS:10 [Rhizophagus irregularis]